MGKTKIEGMKTPTPEEIKMIKKLEKATNRYIKKWSGFNQIFFLNDLKDILRDILKDAYGKNDN